MACAHRQVFEGSTPPSIHCTASSDCVEEGACPDDESCVFAVAAAAGHTFVWSYERTEYDYERPRFTNGGEDVTSLRYVSEKKPRPQHDPIVSLKIFALEEGDVRVHGSPTNP